MLFRSNTPESLARALASVLRMASSYTPCTNRGFFKILVRCPREMAQRKTNLFFLDVLAPGWPGVHHLMGSNFIIGAHRGIHNLCIGIIVCVIVLVIIVALKEGHLLNLKGVFFGIQHSSKVVLTPIITPAAKRSVKAKTKATTLKKRLQTSFFQPELGRDQGTG